MNKRSMLREVSPVILRSANGGRWLTSGIFDLVVEHMREWVIFNGQLDVVRHYMVTTKVPPYIFRSIHVNMCTDKIPTLGMVGLWTSHLEVVNIDG